MSRSKRITETSRYLHSLTWLEFEQVVADYWGYKGWETEVTSTSSDGGVDIIATKDTPYPKTVYLQAKHYCKSNTITGPMVREYAAHLLDKNVDEVLIVTTSSFTTQARKFATEMNLKLIDGTSLSKMLVDDRVDVFLRRKQPSDESLRRSIFDEQYGEYYQELVDDVEDEAYEKIYGELPTSVLEQIRDNLRFKIEKQLRHDYAQKSLEVVYNVLKLSDKQFTISFSSSQTKLHQFTSGSAKEREIPYQFQNGEHHLSITEVRSDSVDKNQRLWKVDDLESLIQRFESLYDLQATQHQDGWLLLPVEKDSFDPKTGAKASASILEALGNQLPGLTVTVLETTAETSVRSQNQPGEISFTI